MRNSLGALAMQHLELFDLEPPFYYYAPHRLVNRDHARMYPLYDALRRRFDCDMNFDLNRLARSTSAGSLQGLSGHNARDIRAAVARLARTLAGRTDHHLLARRLSGVQGLLGPRDALHHGVPALSEIETDVLIIGASLAGAAAAKRTVDAGFRTIILEKKTLPRHKICSGILSPRGYWFPCTRTSASRPTTRSTRPSGSPA